MSFIACKTELNGCIPIAVLKGKFIDPKIIQIAIIKVFFFAIRIEKEQQIDILNYEEDLLEGSDVYVFYTYKSLLTIQSCDILTTPEGNLDFIILLHKCGTLVILEFQNSELVPKITYNISNNEILVPKLKTFSNFIAIQPNLSKLKIFEYTHNSICESLNFKAKYANIIDFSIINNFPLIFAVLVYSYF